MKVKKYWNERSKDNATVMTFLQMFKIQVYFVLDTLIQKWDENSKD